MEYPFRRGCEQWEWECRCVLFTNRSSRTEYQTESRWITIWLRFIVGPYSFLLLFMYFCEKIAGFKSCQNYSLATCSNVPVFLSACLKNASNTWSVGKCIISEHANFILQHGHVPSGNSTDEASSLIYSTWSSSSMRTQLDATTCNLVSLWLGITGGNRQRRNPWLIATSFFQVVDLYCLVSFLELGTEKLVFFNMTSSRGPIELWFIGLSFTPYLTT